MSDDEPYSSSSELSESEVLAELGRAAPGGAPPAAEDVAYATAASSESEPPAYGGAAVSLEEARALILAQRESADTAASSVPPLAADLAEVIVITTSLRGAVHSYFESVRMVHFMNCKRLVWVEIDTNRDVIASRSLSNTALMDAWMQERLLQTSAEGKAHVPQCLIDGVSIGDYGELLALEQDGDLDHIVNRDRCPACLEERERDAAECYYCGALFRALLTADDLRVVAFLGGAEVPRDAHPADYPPPGNPPLPLTSLATYAPIALSQ